MGQLKVGSDYRGARNRRGEQLQRERREATRTKQMVREQFMRLWESASDPPPIEERAVVPKRWRLVPSVEWKSRDETFKPTPFLPERLRPDAVQAYVTGGSVTWFEPLSEEERYSTERLYGSYCSLSASAPDHAGELRGLFGTLPGNRRTQTLDDVNRGFSFLGKNRSWIRPLDALEDRRKHIQRLHDKAAAHMEKSVSLAFYSPRDRSEKAWIIAWEDAPESLTKLRDLLYRERHRPIAETRGERNKNSKLSTQQILDIRSKYSAGGTSQKKLAAEYGVSSTTIYFIVSGLSWKYAS